VAPASFVQRLVGFLVDVVVLILPTFLVAKATSSTHSPWPAILVTAAYYVALTAWRGQTLGKRLLGTRVVMVADERLPGLGPSLVRHAVVVVPGLLVPTGLSGVWSVAVFLPILWGPLHRGVHDRIAGTVVLTTRP
jgi:uncharacterized RDD family membrane protein YckC